MERMEGVAGSTVGTRSVVPTIAAKTNLMQKPARTSRADVGAFVDPPLQITSLSITLIRSKVLAPHSIVPQSDGLQNNPSRKSIPTL